MKKIIIISDAENLESAIAIAKKLKAYIVTDAHYEDASSCKITKVTWYNWPYIFFKCMKHISKANKIIIFGKKISLLPFIAAKICFKKIIMIQPDALISKLNNFFIKRSHFVFFPFPKMRIKNKNSYCFGAFLENSFQLSFFEKKENLNIFLMNSNFELLENALNLLPKAMLKRINLNIKSNFELFKNLNSCQIFLNEANAIHNSHLVIASATTLNISKIQKIGRCAFLTADNEKEQKNLELFELAKSGNEYDLANFIKELLQNEELFYTISEKIVNSCDTFGIYKLKKIIGE